MSVITSVAMSISPPPLHSFEVWQNMYEKLFGLVDNDFGYTVIEMPTAIAPVREVLRRHVSKGIELFGTTDCVSFDCFVDDPRIFERFRSKENRIFSAQDSSELRSYFAKDLAFLASPEILISDEESLGYENIYFRCVRPNQGSDVGEPHADKWFWDLGLGSMPPGHRRVKVWLPIQMDDAAPSFLVIPGSHRNQYAYGSRLGADGKQRPVFLDDASRRLLKPAPVRIGQAVVFHDELIHAGRSTNSLRLSIEFTIIVPERR